MCLGHALDSAWSIQLYCIWDMSQAHMGIRPKKRHVETRPLIILRIFLRVDDKFAYVFLSP